MRKLYLLLLAMVFAWQGNAQQVSSYTFAASAGTYTPITGSLVTLTNATPATDPNPGAWDDSRNTSVPIGFNFLFSNGSFSTCSVSSNGAISFGATSIAVTNYTAIGSNAGYSGAIAAWSRDLLGQSGAPAGEVRYTTLGSAPNRTFVVQWSNARRYNSTAAAERFEMQIRLSETTNIINIVYGTWTNAVAASNANNGQVGLRGTSNSDYKSLSVASGGSWASPAAGTSNGATCFYNQSSVATKPASGQTYTFSPPVNPPNCAGGLSPANAATNVVRNPVISWTAATGSPTSYDVYFGNSPTPPLVNNQAGLTYTPSVLAASTTYYWKVVPKNNNGDAVGCSTQSFTTGTSFNYCTTTYSSGCDGGPDAITNVVLGTLSNPTGCAGSAYTFYSALTKPNITQGAQASVAVTMGSHGNQFAGVWIDFNQNGVFEASEGAVSGNAFANGTATIVLNVPVGAVLGNTRMRVRGGDDGLMTTAQACGVSNSTWGEAEDYIVNVIAMPTDTPDYVNLQFPGSATILAGGSVTAYAQVYEGGLTDVTSGQAPGIEAWIGISPVGSNTNPNTWTNWIPATFNVESGNNDEYMATIGSTLTAGTYYYASRFRLNGGPYVYGGYPFNAWDGTSSQSGVLTVNPNPTQCTTVIAPANGATNVPVGVVTFSWNAPSSGPAPTSYDVYGGTTSGSLTLVTNVTTTTVNLNVSGYSTTFYWRVVPKSTVGGDATGCPEWSFVTQPDPFAPYCSNVTYAEDVEPITLVNFAGINNATGNAVNGTPAIENFTSITGNVTTESTYQMTLKGNTAGNFTTNFRIFIDWNHDGDFADSGEVFNGGSVTNSTGIDAIQAQTNILVPANALGGITRMRIKKLYSLDTGSVTDPCTGGQYGQTEDYSLNVTVCTPVMWYADADGDTYGNPSVSISACNQPAGYVLDNSDCNDTLNAVNPAAAEVAFNGVDDDCDGTIDEGNQLFSQVLPSQCNSTLTTISSLIGAVSFGAPVDGYRFKVVNTSTLAEQVIDRNVPNFQLTQLATYDYATTYSISVQLRRNGVWLNYYGSSCLVSSPAILDTGGAAAVTPSQCGIVLPSISTLVATTSLAGVTGYRFRITNTTDNTAPNQVQTLDRNLHWFALTMLPTFTYGTTYTIEVAVKTNGAYSGFGAPCSVTTPAVPSITNCGVATTGSMFFYTTSLNRVTSYRFELTNLDDFTTTVVDRPVHYFNFNQVPGYVAGAQYAVRVAVMTSGTWSLMGDACVVTAPAAAREGVKGGETAPIVEFRAVGYPNPYAEGFALDMDTSSEEKVGVKIYDMTGRQLEDNEFNADEIEMQEFGERYPSGVYNVIVTQGSFVKTLRMIKR